ESWICKDNFRWTEVALLGAPALVVRSKIAESPLVMLRSLTAWIIIIVFAPSPALRGATLIVSQQSAVSSDDNPGTREKPLKTISAAAAKVHAGDDVIIHK